MLLKSMCRVFYNRTIVLDGKVLRWFLVVCFGLISGCVHYVPKPLLPERTAGQIESRTLADAGLRAFLETYRPDLAKEWPRQRWHLDELILAAFYYHPSLDVARAEWAAAKARIITAGGRPNPILSAGPGYNFSAVGITPWEPFGSLEVTIETAGKRGHRIAQAKYLSESAWLAIATSAWQVRSHLRAQLIEFIAAVRREMLLDQQLSLQEQFVIALEERRQVGVLSTAEVTPSRLLLQKMRLELSDEQARVEETRTGVAEAIGIPVHALSNIEIVFDIVRPPAEAESMTSNEARRRALLGRSDILAALADYAASQSALQLEIAKQYPDIHLGPGYQFDDAEHKWQLGLTIELPVLNRNRGPIAEAEARREASAARFEELQAGIIAMIDRALAVYQVARRTLADTASLLDTQRKRMESVQQQFEVGAADRLDLLGAKLELVANELAVLDSQTKLQRAVGALEEAVQRPFEWPNAIFDSSPKRNDS